MKWIWKCSCRVPTPFELLSLQVMTEKSDMNGRCCGRSGHSKRHGKATRPSAWLRVIKLWLWCGGCWDTMLVHSHKAATHSSAKCRMVPSGRSKFTPMCTFIQIFNLRISGIFHIYHFIYWNLIRASVTFWVTCFNKSLNVSSSVS